MEPRVGETRQNSYSTVGFVIDKRDFREQWQCISKALQMYALGSSNSPSRNLDLKRIRYVQKGICYKDANDFVYNSKNCK